MLIAEAHQHLPTGKGCGGCAGRGPAAALRLSWGTWAPLSVQAGHHRRGRAAAAVPHLVIAAPRSGSGKTTLAVGLMRALRRRGLAVQGFKAGPDYIDPVLHAQATGRPGQNLDTWLMTAEAVRELFARRAAGAQVALTEGVTGLFDGAPEPPGAGSTADLARLLGAPVLLVVDARGAARSLAATALGFALFDPGVRLAGVVANRVASARHRAALAAALEEAGLPLVGALSVDDGLALPEGPLGLVLDGPDPQSRTESWIERAADAVARGVDLDTVLLMAREARAVPPPAPPRIFDPATAGRYQGLRLALAHDAAFWFYYPDALEWLAHLGVEVVPFSPLRDTDLPPGVHGIWLGGGFPERHAPGLAANAALRAALRRAWQAGMPVYAECGGFQYLLGELVTADGVAYPMAGCLPGRTVMERRRAGLGYRFALSPPGRPWPTPTGHTLRRGIRVRGHIFHYGRSEGVTVPPAWALHRADGTPDRLDGAAALPGLASYLHVHLPTQPALGYGFLECCRRFRDGGNMTPS